MTPADAPEIYLARVGAGDAQGLSDLFAEDGLFQGPSGVLRGREAIRAFYVDLFSRRVPQMRVGRTVIEGSRVVFEIIPVDVPRPEEDPTAAIDLLEIDPAGLIAKFTVYIRPPPQA